MAKQLKVSIVICTYNRNKLLKKCLESLSSQSAKKGDYEIIVVDNFVSPETTSIVKKFKARYISENKVGLSHARNAGWQQSSGEYIAYIDDDSIAEKNWVARIIDFAKAHPEISIFGGPYSYYSNIKVPKWYPIETAEFSLGKILREINIQNEYLNGTNFIVKKTLLKKLKGFNTALGMKGTEMGFDEEIDFFKRAAKDDQRIYYIPNLKVKHYLPNYKISLFYLLKRNFLYGKRQSKNDSIVKLLISVVYCPLKAFLRTGGVYPKKWLYYAFAEPAARIGSML